MKKKLIREKRHRLPAEMYVGTKIIAFTLCIESKKKLFETEELFKYFEKELINSINRNKCLAHIYLFMPDHLHLLLEGETRDSNMKRAVELFKQKTGFWLNNNIQDVKWQKDYYDHIIRNNEDIQNQLKYILNNPVRANLIDDWKNYKFKGSTVYNLNDFEK